MKKFVIIVLIILVACGAYKFFGYKKVSTPGQTESKDENVSELTANVGQAISAFGITIKPSEIVEDSRCPSDVQCIQAGRLRIKVEMGSALGATSRILEVGQTEIYDDHKITFKRAAPDSKKSTFELKPSDYSFTFLIEPIK